MHSKFIKSSIYIFYGLTAISYVMGTAYDYKNYFFVSNITHFLLISTNLFSVILTPLFIWKRKPIIWYLMFGTDLLQYTLIALTSLFQKDFGDFSLNLLSIILTYILLMYVKEDFFIESKK